VEQARQPLILIPGSLCDARVWQHQQAALGDIATISIPHLRGHASLAGMAEAILHDEPECFARITRLALIDASIHPVAEGEVARRRPQIEMARAEGMAALARWWNPRITPPGRHDDAAFMGLLESMACSFTAQDYALEVSALLNRPDPRDLLPHIGVPTLVLAGSDDPLSTPERNRAMAAAIPGATLILIEGGWHFPMLEKPDEVTVALRAWLTD
jgi:pimeloyl-ACP methyl ester carboxylesterase